MLQPDKVQTKARKRKTKLQVSHLLEMSCGRGRVGQAVPAVT